ncbi:MAG: hypothetical protein M0D54_19565 [Hyphomonadaceae bacterium JAD_PAG50586_4]|nr:MAG: hypothetical protein M0D54_19565 [Hyphomonadaceae bacterium JAD_PAG50586_4]
MSVLPTATTKTLPALPEGWHVLRFKALPGGRLAMLGVNADLYAAWQTDLEQKTVGETRRLATQASARVWMLQEDQLIEAIRFPLLAPFPLIDEFPDGRWLVANSRSDGQGNARVLSADGAEEGRIELGDGIEHIKIDDQKRIWVGWFDEGVFGNRNWRLPGREWAPSAHGIAAFEDRGALLAHATLESVTDCYALNVFGDEAWACTYTDFPIWQMHNGRERTWPTNLRGTRAIAVKYPHVLAAGGYQDDANGVVLLSLQEGESRLPGEWRLPFGADHPVTMIDGRGDELHLVQGQHWHRWRVADFARAS